MSRRLNWERANLNKKVKLSLSDEREFMERDRAARWLEHQEQRRQAKLMKARQTPSIVDDKDRTRHCPGKVQVNLMRRRASPVTAGLQGSIDDEDDNNNKQFPSLNEVRCAVHFS